MVVESGVCTFLLFLLVEGEKGIKKGSVPNVCLSPLRKYPVIAMIIKKGFSYRLPIPGQDYIK